MQRSVSPGGAAEESRENQGEQKAQISSCSRKPELAAVPFHFYSLEHFSSGEKPSRVSWMFAKPPIKEQSTAKELLLGNLEDILLDLSGTKKVTDCDVENRFWCAESPSHWQSVLCIFPGTTAETKVSRHQPTPKATPVITDKDRMGLSDIRPAAGKLLYKVIGEGSAGCIYQA